ncbi:dolichyl-phosphate beta-D-mannosyltransferase [bacterium K02(2017)]|nr:dolichyl-phosphate beta-D-mannosyltransferase [bacterium K02(2017)]
MFANKILFIIPTYDEIENIEGLIRKIFSIRPTDHILIVDDNSPDGTAQKIKDLKNEFETLHLIERPKKMGLGTAYLAGFKFAVENKFKSIFQMDADGSHDPNEIPNFIEATETDDLIIGSRYIKGGKIKNWLLIRRLLSWCANLYAKIITGVPVNDLTGGYKCFSLFVLETVDFSKVTSEGYSFQIEMNYLSFTKGFKIKEIPITFKDRRFGRSKLSRKIIWEAMFKVWKLRFGKK